MTDAKLHAKRLRDLMTALADFSNIKRKIYIPDSNKEFRKENDSEHSYSLAMSTWYLSQFIPNIDRDKAMRFALAHDIVELHAGDEMAIGRTKEQEMKKRLREQEALNKLEEEWPDFPEMTATIREYEKKDTNEALFVYALDKVLPMQLNLITGGHTWKKYNIKRKDVVANKDEKARAFEEVNLIWKELRKEVLAHDDYFNTDKVVK